MSLEIGDIVDLLGWSNDEIDYEITRNNIDALLKRQREKHAIIAESMIIPGYETINDMREAIADAIRESTDD